MSKKCKFVKIGEKPKFATRVRNRCLACGRPRAFIRRFSLCRMCFRELALKGQLPGVTKSSW